MQRRDFVQWLVTAMGVTAAAPAMAQLDKVTATLHRALHPHLAYSPVNVAHIELQLPPERLEELFSNHAAAARLIHEEVARRTNDGADVPVNLLNIDALHPTPDQLPTLAKLDVYSVSSGLRIEPSTPVASLAAQYTDFWRRVDHDTIGVYSAGNSGNLAYGVPKQSMADFANLIVMVGEAGHLPDGSWQVKSHSQRVGNITLLAPNITDEGFRIPIFNPTPSLKGHEDIVREAEIMMDARAEIKKKGGDLSGEAIATQKEELLTNNAYLADLETRLRDYQANPSLFHQRAMKMLSQEYRVDDQGFGDHVDGTSFCSPYVAGIFTKAKFDGNLREAQNKPSLTSQELIVLAALACEPVHQLQDGYDLPQKTNDRGLRYSQRAGFGALTAEKYQQKLHEAYQILDNNPYLSSQPKQAQVSDFIKKEGVYVAEAPVSKDMTILKTRVEYVSEGIPPTQIKLISPAGAEHFLHMTQATNPQPSLATFYSWGVSDMLLGDSLSGEWRVEPVYSGTTLSKQSFNPQELTLHFSGVEQGGLVDAMIDKAMGVSPHMHQKTSPEKSKGRGR